ncbi:MAG: hypothetical protein JRG73_08050 [Deltaproteobacteria bacterium]|nr:hypothetical protein [Deltaproteobacteria bacterium]MBW2306873.1 hypothetical protein [Deltaproteobacteria bacterium]
MKALFTLTPAESKRLIARAVVQMPEVQRAKSNGYLVVARGVTNAYILEELTGRPMDKELYVAGVNLRGVLCALDPERRLKPITFYKNQELSIDPVDVLKEMKPGDVLLKGANAVDSTWTVGVDMASSDGGTVGQFVVPLIARGVTTIFPVGLEKMIPSVLEASRICGNKTFARSLGASIGVMPISTGQVVTEVQALEMLAGVQAVPVTAGGIGGSEGSVALAVEGDNHRVEQCIEIVEAVKGEKALRGTKGICEKCHLTCDFRGRQEKDVPPYLQEPPGYL